MRKLYVISGLVLATLGAILVVWRKIRKKQKPGAADKAGAPANIESEEIDLDFHDAEARLAAAKLERGARIHDLPVFLLLGDPGAAKTSAIVHSGMDPELLSGQVYQHGELTPTTGVNLWFARQAVFVEAGGKLLFQPEKWNGLLRRLVQRGLV